MRDDKEKQLVFIPPFYYHFCMLYTDNEKVLKSVMMFFSKSERREGERGVCIRYIYS